MPTSNTQQAHATASTEWLLSTRIGWTVYELRGGKKLEQALAGIIGGRPITVNEARPIAGGALLRTEPDSWLLIGNSSPESPDEIQALVDAATTSGYAINASAGYRLFSLEGASCTLLARFCALDLRQKIFPPQSCARLPIVHVPLVIHRPDASTLTLICPASYADSLELMLCAG